MPDFDQFRTDLQRAVEDNEGIDALDKSEAIYFIQHVLTGDMPEEHPNDHNGNATREQVKAWADTLAEHREEAEEAFGTGD